MIVLAAVEYQPPGSEFPGVELIRAPNDDDSSRPMSPEEIGIAARAGNRVARRLLAGRRVLSTCFAGLNRSSLVAGLAMIEAYQMSADEIIEKIRKARGPSALSNPNFERLLRVVVDVRRRQR